MRKKVDEYSFTLPDMPTSYLPVRINHLSFFPGKAFQTDLLPLYSYFGWNRDAWMMVPGWVREKSTPEEMNCYLEKIIDHLDHICQLAGNAMHVGIGSDLDDTFGKEQCPYDLETIAELQKIPALLAGRGYSETDIENIMHTNWLRF